MTTLSQDEIMSNTKMVVQGLETLKNEHYQILNSLLTSMKSIRGNGEGTNSPAANGTKLIEEKTNILKKSIETLELGLSESQVMSYKDRPQ